MQAQLQQSMRRRAAALWERPAPRAARPATAHAGFRDSIAFSTDATTTRPASARPSGVLASAVARPSYKSFVSGNNRGSSASVRSLRSASSGAGGARRSSSASRGSLGRHASEKRKASAAAIGAQHLTTCGQLLTLEQLHQC